MRQTPENTNSSFVNPFALVGKGYQITAGSEITKITRLAIAEADAGCALTALGYPTVDGHNGSRFYIRTAVGILINCKNMDGCVEFIKYIIRNPDNSFIPVYKPILQKMSKEIEEKSDLVSWGKKEYSYSEDDFNKLLNLIHNVRQNNLEDPILYNLVEKEIDLSMPIKQIPLKLLNELSQKSQFMCPSGAGEHLRMKNKIYICSLFCIFRHIA